MARRDVSRWHLFLDESGDFADLDDEVVVGGLLLREDTPGSYPTQIRSAIQQAAPDFPWPTKASELNRPVLFAVANYVRRDGRPAVTPLDQVSSAVVASLESSAPEELRAVTSALAGGRRPSHGALLRLEQVAHRDRARYDQLREVADACAATIGRYIAQLAQANGAEGPALTFFVGCGESQQGDGAGVPPGAEAETVRYLALLKWLVARAVDVLARLEGTHELHLYVLERDVHDAILGPARGAPLHFRHVAPIAREVQSLCAGRGGRPRVEVKVDVISAYDGGMHAALVLADFVVNRARRQLNAGPRPLRTIEDALISEIRCPVRSGEPGASHLAASGVAQKRIEEARSGDSPSGASGSTGTRQWAIEQANEWIAVLRR